MTELENVIQHLNNGRYKFEFPMGDFKLSGYLTVHSIEVIRNIPYLKITLLGRYWNDIRTEVGIITCNDGLLCKNVLKYIFRRVEQKYKWKDYILVSDRYRYEYSAGVLKTIPI